MSAGNGFRRFGNARSGVGLQVAATGWRWNSGSSAHRIAPQVVVAGITAWQRFQFDLWGDTVDVATRLCDRAAPGTVVVAASSSCLIWWLRRACVPGNGSFGFGNASDLEADALAVPTRRTRVREGLGEGFGKDGAALSGP
jgi:hypothetical protein